MHTNAAKRQNDLSPLTKWLVEGVWNIPKQNSEFKYSNQSNWILPFERKGCSYLRESLKTICFVWGGKRKSPPCEEAAPYLDNVEKKRELSCTPKMPVENILQTHLIKKNIASIRDSSSDEPSFRFNEVCGYFSVDSARQSQWEDTCSIWSHSPHVMK